MRRAIRTTLKSSIAVIRQLAALKGTAGEQFHLFGLSAVFRPSNSCVVRFQVRHSWILDVFYILTHFVQNRPNEISKVAHLMKYEFGYVFIILDEGCLRKSSYIFTVFKVLVLYDREKNRRCSSKPEGPTPVIPNHMFDLLAPELFFLILAHTVYKM